MAWYDFFIRKKPDVEQKLNPSQPTIGGTTESSKEQVFSYQQYYEKIEIVNRGVNMIVDDSAEIPVRVGDRRPGTSVIQGARKKNIERLLNHEPNLYQDINDFKRNLLIDYLLDGNIFIYFDGAHLYHLPANKVKIETSTSTYVDYYEFDDGIKYFPDEIIHIKENSFASIYRGTSRLRPSLRTMTLMNNMRNFQDNFFKNGAVPGLVLKSPNTLSSKIKERILASWTRAYNPTNGGKRPLILDGGWEIDSISNVNFKDLDFQPAIQENEKEILKALGVPPILMDSGNNANIRPNLRLYYLETILPIVRKMNYAYSRFFGYNIIEDTTNIPALQPEMRDQSQYYTALVNGGVITVNEARDPLGLEPDPSPESDEIRIPANIAGSAVNPDEGGRPESTSEE